MQNSWLLVFLKVDIHLNSDFYKICSKVSFVWLSEVDVMCVVLRGVTVGAGLFPARLFLSSVSTIALAALPALAQGPVGGTVSKGTASISAGASEMRITQGSQYAVIDWAGFDVSRNHTVVFDQPSRTAATLNRVTGGRESVIAGRVTAPGTVIIQNSAGVLFSGDAKVDVGSLVATNQAVDANRFHDSGAIIVAGAAPATSQVRNEGAITVGEAGLVALVGSHVSNAGTIVAHRGEVALASGAMTTIDLTGDGLARIRVEGDLANGSRVEHDGRIEAAGGRILLSAGTAASLVDSVINTNGVIRAVAAEPGGGTVELVGRGSGGLNLGGRIDAGGVAISGETVAIAASVRSGSAAGVRAVARQDLIVTESLRAENGDIALTADTGDVSILGQSRSTLAVVSAAGDLAIAAPEGSVRFESEGTSVAVRAPLGAIAIDAGSRIALNGSADFEEGSVWIGNHNDGTAITLNAAEIDIVSGARAGASAAVVAGAGGRVALTARDHIRLSDGGGDVAQVVTSNGAPLTMEAPRQDWNGRVISRGRNGGFGGGDVTLSGTIRTTFGAGPVFDLEPDAHFVLASSGPDGASSSLTSLRGFRATTQGEGTIEIGAPLRAANVLLTSQKQVGIGIDGSVSSTCDCDSLMISAGLRFRNDAGEDAVRVDHPDGRWLVFIDPLDGLDGTAPAPREFDLYGRPFAANPSIEDFEGNRIIYGERPTVIVTAESLDKTYGTAVTVGTTVSGIRSADIGAGVLEGGATAGSTGAGALAGAGSYTTLAEGGLSERAATQGYDLRLVDGTLTVMPAPLTVTAEDATRFYGEPNPTFQASFDGFVLGEGVADLGGNLSFQTDAGPTSAQGDYAVMPVGLNSRNYLISYLPGALTVTPRPSINADRSFVASVERFRRGKPPLTPGDASFRTTVAEAGPAVASPFELTYSLGAVLQAAASEFIPAAASIIPQTTNGSHSVNISEELCGGPILIEGGLGTCQMVSATENYWNTVAEIRPQN